MVRILANGDIVPDDDPRVRQATPRRNQRAPDFHSQTGAGNVHHPQFGQNYGPGQQVSIFQSINQRLLHFGIPQWRIGQTVIEPIVSVGFLLAFMLFGFPGVIFGIVLFAVSKWSQDGSPGFFSGFGGNNGLTDRRRDDSNQGHDGDRRRGGGHRLGHS